MKSQKVLEIVLIISAIVSLIVGVYNLASTPVLGVIGLVGLAVLLVVIIYLRRREPYEFRALTNSIVLDIADGTGKTVYYSKTSRLRILRNKSFHYVEDMSTDGDLDSFQVDPGTVESVKKEGGKVLVKTTFGQLRKKGDEIQRTFKCRFTNSFCNEKEYWGQRQTYPTDEFTVTVRFPQDRPYKEFRAVLNIGTYEKACVQPRETVVDEHPALVWSVKRPRLKDTYKLEWVW